MQLFDTNYDRYFVIVFKICDKREKQIILQFSRFFFVVMVPTSNIVIVGTSIYVTLLPTYICGTQSYVMLLTYYTIQCSISSIQILI